MGLGAALGGFFGELSALSTSLALAFAGGAMLYITLDELFPAASQAGRVVLDDSGDSWRWVGWRRAYENGLSSMEMKKALLC